MRYWALAAAICLAGCAHQPRVQNPFPGVFRIAVVPFNDRSNGDATSYLEAITEQFASELQKVPTFEVVPVHEVREVLNGERIESNQPALAYAVARAVHAQAVIVGDVTEFDAYYPPTLGLHCELYAMVTGESEMVVQTPPEARERPSRDNSDLVPRLLRNWVPPALARGSKAKCDEADIDCPPPEEECSDRAQREYGKIHKLSVAKRSKRRPRSRGKTKKAVAPKTDEVSVAYSPSHLPVQGIHVNLGNLPERTGIRNGNKREIVTTRDTSAVRTADQSTAGAFTDAASARGEGDPQSRRRSAVVQASVTVDDYLQGRVPAYQISTVRMDPPEPVIEPWVVRHSRVFDGANLGLVYKLQDYHFFRKDMRGGDWPGYLDRVNDFNRFACNRMIYEMLEAAGGRWTPMRGVRIPKPWLPWPWR